MPIDNVFKRRPVSGCNHGDHTILDKGTSGMGQDYNIHLPSTTINHVSVYCMDKLCATFVCEIGVHQ